MISSFLRVFNKVCTSVDRKKSWMHVIGLILQFEVQNNFFHKLLDILLTVHHSTFEALSPVHRCDFCTVPLWLATSTNIELELRS